MKKTIVLIFLFLQICFYKCQKIGVYESYNPELKHAHLNGFFNAKLLNIEDLNYNIKPFFDSLFIENKIAATRLTDFNISILDNFDPIYGNKKIEKQLEEYCKSKNIDALIIIKSHNIYHSLNPLKNTFNNDLDFGILTHKSSNNEVLYYNNIILLYYTIKKKKLLYPVRKKSENLFYPLTSIKQNSDIYDITTNRLINPDLQTKLFLTNFKNRLQLNFNKILEDIQK